MMKPRQAATSEKRLLWRRMAATAAAPVFDGVVSFDVPYTHNSENICYVRARACVATGRTRDLHRFTPPNTHRHGPRRRREGIRHAGPGELGSILPKTCVGEISVNGVATDARKQRDENRTDVR